MNRPGSWPAGPTGLPAGPIGYVTGADDQDAATPARTGWRPARPELAIAAILVVTLSAASFAFAGPGGLALTLVCTGIAALVALRILVPPDLPALPPLDEARSTGALGAFVGFVRKSAEIGYGTASMAAYDAGLRVTLQHLLAARLSAQHGISLYQDPESARRVLCPAEQDDRLWFWIDPERPPGQDDGSRQGIPPRALATLIDRLERL